MIFCPKTSKLFGFLLKVLQPIGKTLVRLNHCPQLLEHPCLNGKPLPHHRVEPGADCALHSQVIPHTGDFGRQALDLPTEKFECDRIAAAPGQFGSCCGTKNSTPPGGKKGVARLSPIPKWTDELRVGALGSRLMIICALIQPRDRHAHSGRTPR